MTIYRGFGGTNREVKQQFRGLGGVNREIKEVYRGLSGVNRKVFSSAPPKPAGALYWLGDECIALTGGWNGYYTVITSYWNASVSGTKNADCIECSAYSGSTSTKILVSLVHSNPINLTGYTKLYLDMEFPSFVNSSFSNIVRFTTSPVDYDSQTDVSGDQVSAAFSRQIRQIDISSLTGNYYIGLINELELRVGTGINRFYRVWLE